MLIGNKYSPIIFQQNTLFISFSAKQLAASW